MVEAMVAAVADLKPAKLVGRPGDGALRRQPP